MQDSSIQVGSRPQSYPAVSKWLHWITALCVLVILPMGIIMPRLPEGALQNQLFDLHRSTGILVLALAILRVLAGIVFRSPAPASNLTKIERIASATAHRALLLLIFLMPLVGWASMSAYRADVSVYGLFILPNILPRDPTLYALLSWTHTILGYAMAAILVAHIGGALLHGLLYRDGVLNRMLPNSLAVRVDQVPAKMGTARKSA